MDCVCLLSIFSLGIGKEVRRKEKFKVRYYRVIFFYFLKYYFRVCIIIFMFIKYVDVRKLGFKEFYRVLKFIFFNCLII